MIGMQHPCAFLIANLFDLEWNGCLGAERKLLSVPGELYPPSDAIKIWLIEMAPKRVPPSSF